MFILIKYAFLRGLHRIFIDFELKLCRWLTENLLILIFLIFNQFKVKTLIDFTLVF